VWFYSDEVNILNVEELEQKLRCYASRAYHANAQRWVLTVARNYFLNKLSEKDVGINFRQVTDRPTKDPAFHCVPSSKLPDWALKALDNVDPPLYWFDPTQVQRREIWNVLEIIVIWFNNWKADDTRLKRLDRIAFHVATNAAILWYKDVKENIWHYISDKPSVIKTYEHGYQWVKLISAIQFEREGKLMNHCIGTGGYYARWQSNGSAEYYSLRDRHNNPHVTLEISFNGGHRFRKGTLTQCKGNRNSKPDKTYQPYIRQFITDMQWTIVSDASHID